LTYYSVIDSYRSFDFEAHIRSITAQKIENILAQETLEPLDFLSLLSPAALPYLEVMAQKAHAITLRNYGNVIHFFTPFYISNYCENVCAYCSFSRRHSITRRHLSYDDVRREAQRISADGIRHILVLTGESHKLASEDYLAESVKIIKEYFSSVSIEVYPLTSDGYRKLIDAGTDGLTIFQETYDEDVYRPLHSGGPKENYRFRLEAPDRAGALGMRTLTVGALLGLNTVYKEAFFTGLHAQYLQHRYPAAEVAVSLPRIRPLAGEFNTLYPVDDPHFVQILTAMRLFLHHAGITISTRESREMRNALLPLGVTKMSAGVSTSVGGHIGEASTAQFEIFDSRSVEEMKHDLLAMGYQPVMHDWSSKFIA